MPAVASATRQLARVLRQMPGLTVHVGPSHPVHHKELLTAVLRTRDSRASLTGTWVYHTYGDCHEFTWQYPNGSIQGFIYRNLGRKTMKDCAQGIADNLKVALARFPPDMHD
jgi:hypothetical protein